MSVEAVIDTNARVTDFEEISKDALYPWDKLNFEKISEFYGYATLIEQIVLEPKNLNNPKLLDPIKSIKEILNTNMMVPINKLAENSELNCESYINKAAIYKLFAKDHTFNSSEENLKVLNNELNELNLNVYHSVLDVFGIFKFLRDVKLYDPEIKVECIANKFFNKYKDAFITDDVIDQNIDDFFICSELKNFANMRLIIPNYKNDSHLNDSVIYKRGAELLFDEDTIWLDKIDLAFGLKVLTAEKAWIDENGINLYFPKKKLNVGLSKLPDRRKF